MNITKAIIPVAGWGTRRLPITKAIEKCMLPVGNRPIVDYIVEDCIKAGVKDFYFVVSEQSSQIKAYYKRNEALEDHLRTHGKDEYLKEIEPPEGCTFNFIEQASEPHGTAAAIWFAKDVVGDDEQVLVIMGDQFFYHADGGSEAAQFLEKARKADTSAAMLAVEVPHEEVYRYGIVATVQENESEYYNRIVEKPRVEDAPSNLNNASFYLFDRRLIEEVEIYMKQPREGEYLLTDPINSYASAGNKIAVVRAAGEYLDCGNVQGWLYANEVVCRPGS